MTKSHTSIYAILNVITLLLFPLNSYSQIIRGLNFTETTICEGEEAILKVYFNGDPNYVMVIEYEGDVQTYSYIDNPISDTLKEPGIYRIIQYSNASDTATLPISINVHSGEMDVYLSGGGSGCSTDSIEPIIANFSGTSPWTLNYSYNGEQREEEFTDSIYLLSTIDSESIIIIHEISNEYCSKLVTDTAIIDYTGLPKPIIEGPDEVCQGDYSTYTTQLAEYTWKISSGSLLTSQTDNSLDVTWIESGIHSIAVIASNEDNYCLADTTFKNITVYPLPELTSKVDTNIVCFGMEPSIILEPDIQETDLIYWPLQNDSSNSITVSSAGNYEYIVISPYGCEDKGLFVVKESCEPIVYVPDAFSPNGDNINDYFDVFGVFFSLEITLYNVYGEYLIKLNQDQLPWNGEIGNEMISNGTYLWIINCEDPYGNKKTMEGKLTVIK